jgi:cytoskeletal protein CcmA (bactofilin family)
MGLIRSKLGGGDAEQAPGSAVARADTKTEAGDSLIGDGMVLNGDCRTDGTLRVNGHVRGSVQANRLAIGPSGRVDGDVTGVGDGAGKHAVLVDGRVGGAVRGPHVEIGRDGTVGGGIQAKEAVVRGRVTGPVGAEERLILEDTAIVEGDVTARRLGLKEGGQVYGTIRIGDRSAGESASARSASGAQGERTGGESSPGAQGERDSGEVASGERASGDSAPGLASS